jgi:hypothetical protein
MQLTCQLLLASAAASQGCHAASPADDSCPKRSVWVPATPHAACVGPCNTTCRMCGSLQHHMPHVWVPATPHAACVGPCNTTCGSLQHHMPHVSDTLSIFNRQQAAVACAGAAGAKQQEHSVSCCCTLLPAGKPCCCAAHYHASCAAAAASMTPYYDSTTHRGYKLWFIIAFTSPVRAVGGCQTGTQW